MKKKKNNGFGAILCLAVATVVVGAVSISISRMEDAGSIALDVTDAGSKIKEARQNADGTYTVVVTEQGYVGEMTVEINYSADGQTLLSYDVTSHTETENIGTKVNEEEYKAMLAGVKLPVTTKGMDISGILGTPQEDATPSEKSQLTDGTYTVKTEADDQGNYSYVTITVNDQKITNVIWDEITGGASKAELAANGQYVMIEGNPTWKDQSEFLGAYVVEHQSAAGILNETGYTDVVSGVSIYAGGFVELVNQAVAQASAASSAMTEFADGTYTAKTEADDQGNYSYVTITVNDQKITNVVWDEITGGASKAELAANGQYVMIEGNPTWKDQSEFLGAYVVEHQSTAGILNESGHTDVVSGVSISVDGFVDLANQAMAQASGGVAEAPVEAPEMDAVYVDVVTGATFSSKAVLRAIDEGFVYLRDFVLEK